MPTAISTARWRDKPIVPQEYEDIAGLVKVARSVRNRIVEFDWAFTRDDLKLLRRAVYEWGSAVKGRYKCFDARVLTSINDALGETDSIFFLKEPKTSRGTDCSVSCIRDGNLFRLRGHAPFDIVFGYGSAGLGQDVTGDLMGPTAQETLVNAVGMLKWDPCKLRHD